MQIKQHYLVKDCYRHNKRVSGLVYLFAVKPIMELLVRLYVPKGGTVKYASHLTS
jgi:hypothetical protein